MAFDAYWQIEGIKGDSTDDAHPEWIEVDGFSHLIAQASAGGGSGRGSHAGGKADHGDFLIKKRLDASSPALFLHCSSGKHIPSATLEICRAMGEKTVFMKYTFKDLIISSVRPTGEAGSTDTIPGEEVTVRYGEIHLEYTPTDPSGGGKTGGSIQAGWSTQTNKAV